MTDQSDSRWDALTREAIRMIGDQDLSHWSDGHDKVTLEALRSALSAHPTQGEVEPTSALRNAMVLRVAATLNRAGETPEDALRMAEESVSSTEPAAAQPQAEPSSATVPSDDSVMRAYTAWCHQTHSNPLVRMRAALAASAKGESK